MNILLNNRPEHLDAEILSVAELLLMKNFTFKMLLVKIEGQLIKKEDYAESFIKDGNKVDVIHLISGG